MAETEAAEKAKTVRLEVAAARQEESGQGIARMPRSAFQALGITEGDIVEVQGKRMTVAIAMPAYDEDQSLDVVRLDGLQRGNAEAGSGGPPGHVLAATGWPMETSVRWPAFRNGGAARVMGDGWATL